MLHVIVPLGGRATRFQERGYTFPKPLIEIGTSSCSASGKSNGSRLHSAKALIMNNRNASGW